MRRAAQRKAKEFGENAPETRLAETHMRSVLQMTSAGASVPQPQRSNASEADTRPWPWADSLVARAVRQRARQAASPERMMEALRALLARAKADHGGDVLAATRDGEADDAVVRSLAANAADSRATALAGRFAVDGQSNDAPSITDVVDYSKTERRA